MRNIGVSYNNNDLRYHDMSYEKYICELWGCVPFSLKWIEDFIIEQSYLPHSAFSYIQVYFFYYLDIGIS